MFCDEFAMWRRMHEVVWCGDFKNRQPAESERSPICCLPVRIARAAEHRDVTRVGLVHIVATYPATKPKIIRLPVPIWDGTPRSKPQI